MSRVDDPAEWFGVHRVLEPSGCLPYQATRLDAESAIRADEVEVDVELLNIDSAAWLQLRQECHDDRSRIEARLLDLVQTHGKFHNPVTGSGGCLIGQVSALGRRRSEPPVGERICSLISLTCTPLRLDAIHELDPRREQVRVRGRAVLFGSAIYSLIPPALPDDVALALLDVAGAPAWSKRLAQPGMRIAILGGAGKAGILAAKQCQDVMGSEGEVLALCWPPETADIAERYGVRAVAVDCTSALEVRQAVSEQFGGLADLVLVTVNVPGCEGGAVLACKDSGRIMFFSMATSFTAAALTSEALGQQCEMTIGNAYVSGHAQTAFELLERHPELAEHLGHAR